VDKENTNQPIRTSKEGLVLRNGRVVGDVTDLGGHFDKLSLGRRGKQTNSDRSGGNLTQDEMEQEEADGEDEEEEAEEEESYTPIGKRLPRRGVARK